MIDRKDMIRAGLALGLATFVTGAYAQPAKAWSRTIGQTMAANNSPDVVRTDGSGNTFVARTRGFRGTQGNFGIVEVTKLSPTGAGLWTVSVTGQGSGLGRATGMTVDGGGNPIVLQIDNISYLTNRGPIVTKLNGATGAKVWANYNISTVGFTAGGMVNDTAGNVFVCGQSVLAGDGRMAVTKLLAATGVASWTRNVSRVAAGVSDYFNDCAIDSTGNIAMVGTAHPTDACNTTAAVPFVIARVRGTDGAQLWVTTYNNLGTDKVSFPRVGVDSTGNVIVGGTASRVPNAAWIFSKRAAVSGAASWSKALLPMGTSLLTLTDLAVDATGGVAGAGSAFGMTGAGVYVNRYTTAGAQSWFKLLADRLSFDFLPYGQPVRRLVAVGSTSYLCAFTRDTTGVGRTTSVAVLNKLNVSNGLSAWEKTYNGAGTSETKAFFLSAAPNGDAVLGCSVETGSENYPTVQTGIVRLANSNGATVHSGLTSNLVIPSPDFGARVIVDSTGNVYAVGGSLGRIMTVKYSSAGVQLWVNLYDSPATDNTSDELDGGRLILRDGAGNIIVAGQNRGQTVVIKISNSTGGAIWSRRINGSLGFKMALNAAGDVYVPLESPSSLVKLAAATGIPAWTAPMNGTGAEDNASFAVTDGSGNPYVAGTTTAVMACPEDNQQKIMVERFNPSTGAKVWLKEVVPYKPGTNHPCGIGIDNGGNVLVGGTAEGVSSWDFIAVKLNATTGAQLWNTRHDYLTKDQLATAMLVDGAGNLVIAGVTRGPSYRDGWTVKVLDSTGAKSWSSLMAGPAGDKWPYDIARDGSNNIYVGGLSVLGASLSQYGLKLVAATGATTWTALTALGLGMPDGGVGVAVSTTNRLHMVGTNVGTGTSLANMTLVQYNP